MFSRKTPIKVTLSGSNLVAADRVKSARPVNWDKRIGRVLIIAAMALYAVIIARFQFGLI